jgi:excisionase family DNA binding protein
MRRRVANSSSEPPRAGGGTLEELIREIVRDELRKALATAPSPAAVEYLTTNVAAALACVAAGTIRRWIREGRLEDHRAGRVVRVRREDLETLLRDGGREHDEITPEELARRDFG